MAMFGMNKRSHQWPTRENRPSMRHEPKRSRLSYEHWEADSLESCYDDQPDRRDLGLSASPSPRLSADLSVCPGGTAPLITSPNLSYSSSSEFHGYVSTSKPVQDTFIYNEWRVPAWKCMLCGVFTTTAEEMEVHEAGVEHQELALEAILKGEVSHRIPERNPEQHQRLERERVEEERLKEEEEKVSIQELRREVIGLKKEMEDRLSLLANPDGSAKLPARGLIKRPKRPPRDAPATGSNPNPPLRSPSFKLEDCTLKCGICNWTLENKEYWQAHLSSPLHQSKLQGIKATVRLPAFYCTTCHTVVRSEVSLAQHLKGGMHMSRLHQATVVQQQQQGGRPTAILGDTAVSLLSSHSQPTDTGQRWSLP